MRIGTKVRRPAGVQEKHRQLMVLDPEAVKQGVEEMRLQAVAGDGLESLIHSFNNL